MPPKKKKKKGGKKGKGKGKGSPQDAAAMLNPKEPDTANSVLHRQSLEDKLRASRARCESLRQHNEMLKVKRAKGEKDTHDLWHTFRKRWRRRMTGLRTIVTRSHR